MIPPDDNVGDTFGCYHVCYCERSNFIRIGGAANTGPLVNCDHEDTLHFWYNNSYQGDDAQTIDRSTYSIPSKLPSRSLSSLHA